MADLEAAKKQFDTDLKEYNALASELRPIADKFLDYERQLGSISETSPQFPVFSISFITCLQFRFFLRCTALSLTTCEGAARASARGLQARPADWFARRRVRRRRRLGAELALQREAGAMSAAVRTARAAPRRDNGVHFTPLPRHH